MTPAIFQACGGLGLFLLGMLVLSEGLRAVAGGALEATLTRFVRNPATGAVTGATTTALIQSSSATSVAAVGFVSAGLLTFPQALGILFGANVGTTITGWLVALFGFRLPIGEAAYPLVLLGVLLRFFGKRGVAAAGQALAGFAVVFVGIGLLQSGMSGLEGVLQPDDFPSNSWGGRLALLGLGVVLTVVTQSSSAGVATAIAAVSTGTIRFEQAAAMVIGMDVGTTFTALLATVGGGTQARRTGFAHVTYNLLTGLGAFLLLPAFTWALHRWLPGGPGAHPEFALVGFHSAFNLLGVLAILPFTDAFAGLICRLVPARGSAYTQGLDRTLLRDPSAALNAATGSFDALVPAASLRLAVALERATEALHVREEMAPFLRDLGTLRRFVDDIQTSSVEAKLDARHQDLRHVDDHLRRLIARCGRKSMPAGLTRDEYLAGALREVVGGLRLISLGARDPRTSMASVDLHRLWKRLRDEEEDYRRTILRAAATDELDDDEAMARLDAARRLRRITYHAWRIVAHLDRVHGSAAPGTREELHP